jgi:3-hydroxyisobutyrate dehydrogenase-like beta-hydroxyacid dehydrogenase
MPWRRLLLRAYSVKTGGMRYGFVGLGQMGYPMAMNLLRKTAAEKVGGEFTIYDVNPLSLSRFTSEASTVVPGVKVSVALHPKDLAEKSVWILVP